MKSVLIVGLALALSIFLVGNAQAKPDAKPAAAPSKLSLTGDESARSQLDRVELSLNSADYREMGVEERSKVQAALNRIRVRMGDHEDVESTNPQARTDIFNDQEVVNTLMARAHDDNRMVCRREVPTGSNRPQQVCMTVGQRRQLREDSKENMRMFMNVSPRSGNP